MLTIEPVVTNSLFAALKISSLAAQKIIGRVIGVILSFQILRLDCTLAELLSI